MPGLDGGQGLDGGRAGPGRAGGGGRARSYDKNVRRNRLGCHFGAEYPGGNPVFLT